MELTVGALFVGKLGLRRHYPTDNKLWRLRK
jgi:hypothetical protein